MDHAEIQALVRKFAAPLADYASTSKERKELAEMLVRHLWIAMVCGPVMEEETWKVIKQDAHMDDDSLQPLKDLYFQKMKPVVTDEQRAILRQRYQVRRKQAAT